MQVGPLFEKMKKKLINDGWKFKKTAYDEAALTLTFGANPEGYRDVELPHDALISKYSDFYKDFVIWYKRSLDPAEDYTPGKRYFLYFDGVYMDADVYINGKHAFTWVNGYTSFHFEITDYLGKKENEILVRIKYRCPNARWYAGPGINRNVWLYESETECFVIDSLYVSAKKATKDWKVSAFIETKDSVPSGERVVFSIDGYGEFEAELKKERIYGAEITVSDPLLWDIDSPNLYRIKAKLIIDDTFVDEADSSFGFRDIKCDPDRGFFLNGRRTKIKGVCIHNDYGALGSAYNEDAAIRALNVIRDMGANALRLAHNVYAPGFMDLCDKMGFMVLSEAFDCWREGKTEYDYGRFFDEWSALDIKSWITRDRNHPSIIMFSAGNEIYDTHKDEKGKETLEYIVGEIKKYDFCENAFITLCSNYMAWDNTVKAVDGTIKAVGYNYAERLYEKHHKDHPDWCIFGSETASLVQSRGIYHFPYDIPLLSDDDMQCSSLGNSTTSWGAPNIDFCLAKERDCDFSMGQFLWAGIDYLGEPTPYHTKNSYLGIIDTALFPKDIYYVIKSQWNEKADKFVHIFPYWDYNPGQKIDVLVASNADRVSLFKDGILVGTKEIDHRSGKEFCARFALDYAPGVIEAVGYDSEGREVARQSERSFGDVEKLELSEDTFEIKKDDRHLRFVVIKGLDEKGNEVKNANSRVRIKVKGPGKLVGLDNGDSTDYDSFTGNSKRLFGGCLLAIIKPDGEAGTISVTASIDDSNISVRKVELKHRGSLILQKDRDSISFDVEVYPPDANNYKLEYQITNNAGTSIGYAVIDEVTPDNRKVHVKALSDGEFKLRAIAREASGRVSCISAIEIKAEGIGTRFVNPYEFVYASTFDEGDGEIGNGNEKGISTSRLVDSWILFNNVDFGEQGSKEITLPIFELDSEETKITLFDGKPGEKTSLVLLEATYHKPSRWNVYQEETYTLDKPLKGVHDLAIMTHAHKIHLKGFKCTPYNRTYETNPATEALRIYGDSYEVKPEAVENIGNNVTLDYGEFDFEEGLHRIIICGRSELQINTIHLILFSEGESERKIIEFKGTGKYETQEFETGLIKGKTEVKFLFLPGSKFDFKYFKFEKK